MATRRAAKPAKKTTPKKAFVPKVKLKVKKPVAKAPEKKKKTKTKASALEAVRGELQALVDVRKPEIPVDRLVGEGNALVKVVARYEKALRKVGIDKKLLASLEKRVDALSEAQSELSVVRSRRRPKIEVKLEAEAVELRGDLLADGRFALRGDDNANAVLDAVQEGEGLDDLVQDLKDLAAFATKHKAAYARVGAKATKHVERAQDTAEKLEAVVAERRTSDSDEAVAVDVRDRAATYLTLAMREIRAGGVYAFRKEPDVLVRFRSAYNSPSRKRGGTGAAEPSTSAEAPETA